MIKLRYSELLIGWSLRGANSTRGMAFYSSDKPTFMQQKYMRQRHRSKYLARHGGAKALESLEQQLHILCKMVVLQK